MKKSLALLSPVLSAIYSCTPNCDGEQPRARIVNNGTDKASVQIKTSGGNTENINNISTGSTSEWRSFAPGNTQFRTVINNSGLPDDTLTINMQECWEYEIQIGLTNQVNSVPTDRNE